MSADTDRDATLEDYTDQPDADDAVDDSHTCRWCGTSFESWLEMARHDHGTDDTQGCEARADHSQTGASVAEAGR